MIKYHYGRRPKRQLEILYLDIKNRIPSLTLSELEDYITRYFDGETPNPVQLIKFCVSVQSDVHSFYQLCKALEQTCSSNDSFS